MAFFSASVTVRGRSRFDTHASDESISPGVRAGSGTVQDPLDLSTSAFRQCCADAKLVRTKKLINKVSRRIETSVLAFYGRLGEIQELRILPRGAQCRIKVR